MPQKQPFFAFKISLCFLCLFGCQKYSLSVTKEHVDRNSLASTYVRSPDPRQKNPPKGQRLIIKCKVPSSMVNQDSVVLLTLLFRNYTQETIRYPINRRRKIVFYSLLGEDYGKTGGLLTYKVEIIGKEGEVKKEWKEQLWTNLITIEDPQTVKEEIREEEREE